MKKFFHIFILLLIPHLCSYAQSATTDWAKMGLKDRVKSVETSFYFTIEKDGKITKGDPFSMGFYPSEKIEQMHLMQRMGGCCLFCCLFDRYCTFGNYL